MRLECRLSATLPFHAYRSVEPGGAFTREIELVSSLEHFFQSERFRGINDELRLEVLNQPTAREARKFAVAHQRHQRTDWEKRQPRILRCGMWFQCIEHPWVADVIRSGSYVFDRLDPFWRPRQGDGAYRRLELFLRDHLTKPMSVLVFGLGEARGSQFRVDIQLQKLFRNQRPDELLIGDGYGLDNLVEAWAIEHTIAIRRRPRLSRIARISDKTLREVFASATHAAIFQGKNASPEILRLADFAARAGVISRTLKPPSSLPITGQSSVAVLHERSQHGQVR